MWNEIKFLPSLIMETSSDLKPFEITPSSLEHQLPEKTDYRYEKTYATFVKWQKETNETTSFDENTLLAYLNELSKTLKCSSLWCMYSMLKRTIYRHHNVDISLYSRLSAFLKEKSMGYESKKCKVFSADEIQRFLTEAPDEDYLAMKVTDRRTFEIEISFHFLIHSFFRRQYWSSE